jgi:hypothetical protein
MKSTNTIWVLVAGLAVGFLIGREMPRRGSDDTPSDKKTTASSGSTGQPSKNTGGGPTPTEIPSDWIKESEIGATADFADLTPQQRYLALKVMNEKPCDCGCPHFNTAKCKKEDPGCPRAPLVLKQTLAMVKQGKSFDEMIAALKKPDAPPQQPKADGPQKIELAAWTPIQGPKFAKVTIVEYSDFQ